MKALSLRQPWCAAVLYGGKRVENRTAWRYGSRFRGPLLLHAAAAMTQKDWNDCAEFVRGRRISWQPPLRDELVFGALVGVAVVVDVIMPGGLRHPGGGRPPSARSREGHTLCGDPWYQGAFALVLDHVAAFEVPIPYKGSLGFFEVPDALVTEAVSRGRGSALYAASECGKR